MTARPPMSLNPESDMSVVWALGVGVSQGVCRREERHCRYDKVHTTAGRWSPRCVMGGGLACRLRMTSWR